MTWEWWPLWTLILGVTLLMRWLWSKGGYR